jgi:hypothetical protein
MSFLRSDWEAPTTATIELPSPNQHSAHPLYMCAARTHGFLPSKVQSLRALWKQ